MAQGTFGSGLWSCNFNSIQQLGGLLSHTGGVVNWGYMERLGDSVARQGWNAATHHPMPPPPRSRARWGEGSDSTLQATQLSPNQLDVGDGGGQELAHGGRHHHHPPLCATARSVVRRGILHKQG